MVLEYKGFNNNWCYTEAETIIHTNVYIGKETEQYREGGDKFSSRKESIDKGEEVQDETAYIKEMYNAVTKLIKEESGANTEEIAFCIGGVPLENIDNVAVVILSDRNLSKTYVFKDAAYLLNSSGKVVKRLC